MRLVTCCVFTLCDVWTRSARWSTTQSWAFLVPEWVVQVQRWSLRGSIWNFLQPQSESGNSVRSGILVPTHETNGRSVDLPSRTIPWYERLTNWQLHSRCSWPQPEGSASGRLKDGEPFPSPSVYHCFCQSVVVLSQRPEHLHFHRSSFPFILHWFHL